MQGNDLSLSTMLDDLPYIDIPLRGSDLAAASALIHDELRTKDGRRRKMKKCTLMESSLVDILSDYDAQPTTFRNTVQWRTSSKMPTNLRLFFDDYTDNFRATEVANENELPDAVLEEVKREAAIAIENTLGGLARDVVCNISAEYKQAEANTVAISKAAQRNQEIARSRSRQVRIVNAKRRQRSEAASSSNESLDIEAQQRYQTIRALRQALNIV